MTQASKTTRKDRLQGVGIEGSSSRSPALGIDDPRHRTGADRERVFDQRFSPDDFDLDADQRVIVKAGRFLAATEGVEGTAIRRTFRAISADATVLASDDVLLVTTGAGALTVTLPPALSHKGRQHDIKKVDSGVGVLTVDGDGAETIDGAATLVYAAQWETHTLSSDGTAWYIL